jgi:RES domain
VTLSGFPRRTVRGDAELYRIHRRERGAWWFSFDGSGRFDPVGSGLGACYLAEQPLAAWVEVFRREMVLSELAVLGRALSRLRLGRDMRLADLTSRRALQFGVTASLGAGEDYGESQAFAVRAVQSGFAGVRYLLRHDPAQKLCGIALFGAAGESSWREASVVSTEPIPGRLVEEAQARFRYRVLPTP